MGELEGRVALVTGAAMGLGEAMARTFAREGAHVVIADVDDDLGAAVAREIGGTFRHLDVTDEQGWIDVLASTRAEQGPLDVLVNNAAIYRPNIPFLEMSLATWREHMSVNAESVFLGCKHGISGMAAQKKGSIVNISSSMALMALPDASAYITAKGAVLSITRLASRAAGPLGIRVNAILPGPVITAQLRGNLVEGQTIEEFVDMLVPLYPLGRIGRKEDIAEAALFLASDRSSFVSGNLLRVDGAQDP